MLEPAYRLVHYHTLNVVIHKLDGKTTFELSVMLDKKNPKTEESKFCIGEYVSTRGLNTYLSLNWNLKIHSFDYTEDSDGLPFYVIFPDDWYPFKYNLTVMKRLLTEPIGKDMFYQDQDGKIKCSKKFSSLPMVNQMNARLEITPMVEARGFGTVQSPGVGIYINERTKPIFMPTLKYLSFVDIVEHLDPINLSVSMLSLFNHGPDVVVPDEEQGYLASVGAKRRAE